MKRTFLYIFYILIVLEVFSKILFFSPFNDQFLELDNSAVYRTRWVRQHLVDFLKGRDFFPGRLYDSTKGWTLLPNLRNERQPYLIDKFVNSNSIGIRGIKEYLIPKPLGVKRILLIGDSFTFGNEVNDNETYAYYLQELLGDGYEVINMGVYGYGHDQMLIKLKEEAAQYQPDFIMLGFVSCDIARNMMTFTSYSKPRYTLRNNKLKSTNASISTPKQIFTNELFKLHFIDLLGVLKWAYTEKAGAWRKKEFKITTVILNEMKDFSDQIGAKLVILDLPLQSELFEKKVNWSEEYLSDYTQSNNVSIIYFRETLKKNIQKGRQYKMEGHYGSRLHRDIADQVFMYINGKK